MSATERISSRSTSDADGKVSTTRVYLVNKPPDTALDDVDVPKDGDTLPWDDSQQVVSRSAMWETGSIAYSAVTVIYSNDGGNWGGPADPLFKSWTLSYRTVAVQIPYSVEDPRKYRYRDSNGQVKIIPGYPVQAITHWESRKIFSREVRVTNFYITQWEAIGDQNDKLHKIGNRWYRFTIGDVREVSRNVWDAVYTWEFDPGTPDLFPPPTSALVYPWHIASQINGFTPDRLWARPPYHSLRAIPQFDNDIPIAPIMEAIPEYDYFTPNGWQLLPGVTL